MLMIGHNCCTQYNKTVVKIFPGNHHCSDVAFKNSIASFLDATHDEKHCIKATALISTDLRISTWSKEHLLQSAAAARCRAAGNWSLSCISVAVCPFYRHRRRKQSHYVWQLPAPWRRQMLNSWPTSPGTATTTKIRTKKAKSWRASAGSSDRATPRWATV